MDIRVLAVFLLSSTLAFAQTTFTQSPSSVCPEGRDSMRTMINNFQPTTAQQTSCKNNLVTALNCCNGATNSDECNIVTSTPVNAGLGGANATQAAALQAMSQGVAQNKDLCTKQLTNAVCDATDAAAGNLKQNILNANEQLGSCFDKFVAKSQALQTAGFQSADMSSTSGDSDGVTHQGIQDALHAGADNSASEGSGGVQTAGLIRNTVNCAMFACSVLAGSPTGPPKQNEPSLAPAIIQSAGPSNP